MNKEKIKKAFCANCFEELQTTDICPYCGYNPVQDNEKYPLALPHNTILNGRYITGRVLGQGGFGITYIVKDWKTKNRMVIKEYLPDTMATRTDKYSVSAYSGQPGESFEYGKKCFLEEAQTLAGFIGNPNIVQVHSYFEENGTAYFVMDYIEGTSFQKVIIDNGGKLLWQEAEKFLLPVMDALDIVHSKGIIHRDVTPDNIFITTDGTVKLLDFGAARYSLGDRSQSLDIVLKHGFAPKEQYTRHGKQGPYTDVYTVAASFYYAITGRKPPDSIDRLEEDDLVAPSRLGVKIPEEVENAILKGMEVQPADRYQSMAEFKQALTIQENSEDKTPPPPPTNADTNTVNSADSDSKFHIKINREILVKTGLAAAAVLIIVLAVKIVMPKKSYEDTTSNKSTMSDVSNEHTDVAQIKSLSVYKPVGNTANNLANGAKAVYTDDFYYACYPETGLFKINNDENTLLVEGSVSSINFDNGIVYYLDADGKAYQVNADGTEQAEVAQLNGITCSMLYVMKDRFYYLRPSESGTGFDIYYVTRNDENAAPVKLANCYSINTAVFAGESLYYIAPDGDGLYKLDAASEEPENVYADACNTTMLAVEDNVVYGCYRSDDCTHIWKYSNDKGSGIYSYKSESSVMGLNVYNNNIYFTEHYPDANGTSDRFCKVSSNGDSKKVEVLYQAKEGIVLSNISIMETGIACIDYTGTKENMLVISLDGNNSSIWGDDSTENNMVRASSEGNTMGNIINDGIAVEDEQYKYYAGHDHIIRVSKDTGEEKALKNSPGFAESLNLYNGYLYYISGDNIYQIDIEGEKNEMVLEGTGYDQMYIADGTAYIHTRFDELVCADAKNWEVRNTLSDIYDNYTISGEWVYYQNDNDYEYDFYRIKLDGTEKKRLSDSLMFSPVVKDNWVYGRSTSKIFRIATDGSSEEKIYYSSNDIYRMNAGDGRIYYTEDKNKKTSVYCMNLDGTKRTKLFTEKRGTSVYSLNILKDELVFKDYEEDGIVVINMQTGDTTIYHDNDNVVENNSADDDYIFPDSDTKKLTKKMAARLSKSSVRLAINEIYARHGRRFDDKNLQKYFNEKDWYIGTIDAKDFNESVFNKIEKYNIRLLEKYR